MATNNKANVELMAPVGSYESLHAAINAGCDSIFFGITQLNMRARSSKNFTIDDLKKIAKIAKDNKVKSYLTLNTVLYDHDQILAYKIIDAAKEAGISSVIASDMAAILYGNKVGQPIHISTQLSVSNIESVKFFAQYSEMIVLARELTIPQVKHICEQVEEQDIKGTNGKRIKIEIFGHGAMCVAYSGRCHMSLLTDNSSANRGACNQNCRRKYRVIDDETNTELVLENNYVMSPSDLCTISILDELVDAGIAVLKIEGRGRSADYVDRVISTYREALDAIAEGTYTKEKIKKWNETLKTVYNRDLSPGFYMRKPYIKWSGAYGNKATKTKVQLGKVVKYYPNISVVEVEMTSGELSAKDEYVIIGETTGTVRGENPELRVDEKSVDVAVKKDLVTFKVNKKVKKGDRLYKMIDSKEM